MQAHSGPISIPRCFGVLSSERSRQQNRKKESSSSSAPRRPTSPAATAASKLNNVNHHERRFAEYKLANINQPLQRGGGSRGGGWGRTGRGKGWLRDYLNQPRLAELEVTDNVTKGVKIFSPAVSLNKLAELCDGVSTFLIRIWFRFLLWAEHETKCFFLDRRLW